MFKINCKKQKINAGFTLLEALVATSILMVAVAAPITIAQKGLSSAVYSKNQMIAAYLAQDAIEYVKNVRDEASINSTDAFGNHTFDWALAFPRLNDCLVTVNPEGCQIDTIASAGSGVIKPYSENPEGQLSKDPNTGFYGFDGEPTNFNRQIKITLNPYKDTNPNPNEAKINVIVSWGEGENKVDVSTLIYNI